MTAACTPALGTPAFHAPARLARPAEVGRAQDSAQKAREQAVGIDVEACYRRYGAMVLRRCRTLLRHEEKAHDAMHDVFVQVLRRKDRLTEDAPSSLLYRIATNVCLNRIRGEGRRPEHPADELLFRIAAASDPEESLRARSLLGSLFAKEQESTRTIAVLHLLDGMSLEEVAAEVGMSVSGVRKRLRALRAHVRELEEVCP